MFEQLFGSKTRVKLLKTFIENKDSKFFVRELTRMTDSMINSVRRELNNLLEMKLVNVEDLEEEDCLSTGKEKKGINSKKFYYLNTNNIFLPELENLFAKAKLFVEKKLLDKIKKLPNLLYLSFGGVFTEDETANTDILLVANCDKEVVLQIMQEFEKEMDKPIRYTILTESEYLVRRDIADRFLNEAMHNGRKLVVLNKLDVVVLENKEEEK